MSGGQGSGAADGGRAGRAAGLLSLYSLAPVMRAGSFIMPARANQRAGAWAWAGPGGPGRGRERSVGGRSRYSFQLVSALTEEWPRKSGQVLHGHLQLPYLLF